MTVRCADVRIQFAILHDGSADEAVRRRISEHLSRCPACTLDWERSEDLLGDLAVLRQIPPPPVDVSDRVMAEIRRQPSDPARVPWIAASTAVVSLTGVLAAGWFASPWWIAEMARAGGKLAALAMAVGPVFLAVVEVAGKAAGTLARVMTPGIESIQSLQPWLLGTAYVLCAAVVAASVFLAGREWRVARRQSGAPS